MLAPVVLCTFKAVVEEMFICKPPAAVKPERKVPLESLRRKRLAVAEAMALTIRDWVAAAD